MQRYIWAGAVTLTVLGCAGEAANPTRPDIDAAVATATPHFLSVPPTAPPLVSATVSFWAVQGQDREAAIFYKKRVGPPTNSDRLSRFRVRKDSRIILPNGTPLAPGDSVRITMKVVDPSRQMLEFLPSGLKFRNRPADLTLWYLEANHDFNGDGVINGQDAIIENTFRIWRKDGTQPWAPQVTDLEVTLDEAEADITGFTRFAVAY